LYLIAIRNRKGTWISAKPSTPSLVLNASDRLIRLKIYVEPDMKSESMSTNLRVCVVGAGLMGADHIARLTSRIVGAEVSAVVDADASRAKKAVEAISTAVALSNIGQALDREDVNAVLIATPGFLHRDMLLQVRERDLPILCEKPLTPDAQSSWEILEAEQRLGKNASRSASCVASIRNTKISGPSSPPAN
jgi:hypothetical protein